MERCLCPYLPCELYCNYDGFHELITVIAPSLESNFDKVLKKAHTLA